MTTTEHRTSPHNHWACRGNCASEPLTLADREVITGRAILCGTEDDRFCGDCLADLPGSDYETLFHVTVGGRVRHA